MHPARQRTGGSLTVFLLKSLDIFTKNNYNNANFTLSKCSDKEEYINPRFPREKMAGENLRSAFMEVAFEQ